MGITLARKPIAAGTCVQQSLGYHLGSGDWTPLNSTGGRRDKMLSPENASVNEMQGDAPRNLHWTRENMLHMTSLNLVGK